MQISKFVDIKNHAVSLNISVIIPNYNGVHLFPDTLPALKAALDNCGREYEIIVVDDCSTDTSVDFLKLHYPEIISLQNIVNSGFSITVNKGIHAARYELVLLLNSDVRLEKEYFTAQFPYFELENTFGVMGKIVGWDDDFIQDGSKYPKFSGFKLKTSGNYLPPENSSGLLAYTMYLSGANALVRRDRLLMLNGMDQIYSPFYMEDVDLSVRAWRAGFKCYFEPNSVCRHRISESIRTKEKKEYIRTVYNRNKLFFHAIHLDGPYFAGWLLQVFLELIFRILTLRIDYLKSVIQATQSWSKIRESRRHLLKLRDDTGIMLSLADVKRVIRDSLTDRKIQYFKR